MPTEATIRTEKTTVLLAPAEKERWERAAAKAHVPLATWVRGMINAQLGINSNKYRGRVGHPVTPAVVAASHDEEG